MRTLNGSSVTTSTSFSNQDTNGVLVDITGPNGATATADIVTGGDLMTNLEVIRTSNDKFRVGDSITITENGGTGVATATVSEIHEGQKIGAIASTDAFNTDNPFDAADTSGIAVTFTPSAGVTSQLGAGLAGTATTSGPNLLDSVQLTDGGYGFLVDDIIEIEETGGSGIGHIRVLTLA